MLAVASARAAAERTAHWHRVATARHQFAARARAAAGQPGLAAA